MGCTYFVRRARAEAECGWMREEAAK